MSENLVHSLGFTAQDGNIYWSYDGEPYSFRKNSAQLYLEKPVYGLTKLPGDIRSECFSAARSIHEQWKRPTILYSGGIDSEVVLLSFLLQKLPVEVVIADFYGKNGADIERAKAFCDKHRIAYKLHQFDPVKYWENDLWQDAQDISCASPQIMVHCKIAEQIGNYVIVGGGDSHLMRSKRAFFETTSEKWALGRWMLKKKIPGCPRFFQYTASLEAAFLFEPIVEQFVANAWTFFEFRKFMYLKPFIFHKHFQCEIRGKLTGFEELHAVCEEYRAELGRVIPVQNEISWSYEQARNWALSPHGASEYLSLAAAPIESVEKENLSKNDIRSHLFWVN